MRRAYYCVAVFLFLLVGTTCLFGVSTAQNNKTCTVESVNYPPVENLDISRLDLKRWYIQEIFPLQAGQVSDPPSIDCYLQLIALYDPPVGPFTHQFYEIYTNVRSNSTDVRGMNGYPSANSTAVWEILSNTAISIYTTVFTFTDYETYGVMHFCPYFDGDGYYEEVLTFTGVPDPEDSLLVELKKKVASMGYPTEHGVRVPHHEHCDYAGFSNHDNGVTMSGTGIRG